MQASPNFVHRKVGDLRVEFDITFESLDNPPSDTTPYRVTWERGEKITGTTAYRTGARFINFNTSTQFICTLQPRDGKEVLRREDGGLLSTNPADYHKKSLTITIESKPNGNGPGGVSPQVVGQVRYNLAELLPWLQEESSTTPIAPASPIRTMTRKKHLRIALPHKMGLMLGVAVCYPGIVVPDGHQSYQQPSNITVGDPFSVTEWPAPVQRTATSSPLPHIPPTTIVKSISRPASPPVSTEHKEAQEQKELHEKILNTMSEDIKTKYTALADEEWEIEGMRTRLAQSSFPDDILATVQLIQAFRLTHTTHQDKDTNVFTTNNNNTNNNSECPRCQTYAVRQTETDEQIETLKRTNAQLIEDIHNLELDLRTEREALRVLDNNLRDGNIRLDRYHQNVQMLQEKIAAQDTMLTKNKTTKITDDNKIQNQQRELEKIQLELKKKEETIEALRKHVKVLVDNTERDREQMELFYQDQMA
eukprot:PhF_6_TR2264/c2_g1_i3/m.3895